MFKPGQIVCQKNDFILGQGFRQQGDNIVATICGQLVKNNQLISIQPENRLADAELKSGSIIIGQITNIREDRAFVKILKVDGNKFRGNLEAVLRKQNIRSHEIDKIEMNKCFIPGDLVQTRLISFGDSQRIYLSTVEDDMGVVFAKNQESQRLMVPLSWEEMVCIETGLKEFRKVAKPDFSKFE
ncbi:hypothetical protein pb186bvf_000036 [Paramecium bursaria]